MTLAETIRKRRHELGWSQDKLAEQIGTSQGYIARLERNTKKQPQRQRKTLMKLQEALSLDLSEFMPPETSEAAEARNLSYHMLEYRKRTKRSKADIAAEIGISVQTYSRIETQRLKPTDEVLERIAGAMEMTVKELLSKPIQRDVKFSNYQVDLIVTDFRRIIKTMHDLAAQWGAAHGLTDETIQLAADCAAHIEIKKQAQRYAANMNKPFHEIMRVWEENREK